MRYYSSVAVDTTLTGGVSSGAVSFTVASVTGWPVSFPFTAHIDLGTANEEIVEVTAAAGTTWTVTRGVDGSSPISHSLGATVVHGVSARDFSEVQTHMAASTGVHGIAGGSSVVGTTDVQTLTNKILTSPTINTPTTTNPTITGGGSWSGSPTLVTPTIASLTNMQHNHSNAAGGGSTLTAPTITTPAITTPVITAAGSWAGNPTFSGQPSIADLTNVQHDHSAANKGGSILQASVTGLATALTTLTNTSIRVFATNAARDAAITVPTEGMMAYTQDSDIVWLYITSWVPAAGSLPGAKISRSTNLNVSSGSNIVVTLGTNEYSTTPTLVSGNLLAPTVPGRYSISCFIQWAGGSGYYQARILDNAGTALTGGGAGPFTGSAIGPVTSCEVKVNVTSGMLGTNTGQFSLGAFQNSGGVIAITNAYLAIQYMGPAL